MKPPSTPAADRSEQIVTSLLTSFTISTILAGHYAADERAALGRVDAVEAVVWAVAIFALWRKRMDEWVESGTTRPLSLLHVLATVTGFGLLTVVLGPADARVGQFFLSLILGLPFALLALSICALAGKPTPAPR
jgi:hypothetical protein